MLDVAAAVAQVDHRRLVVKPEQVEALGRRGDVQAARLGDGLGLGVGQPVELEPEVGVAHLAVDGEELRIPAEVPLADPFAGQRELDGRQQLALARFVRANDRGDPVLQADLGERVPEVVRQHLPRSARLGVGV